MPKTVTSPHSSKPTPYEEARARFLAAKAKLDQLEARAPLQAIRLRSLNQAIAQAVHGEDFVEAARLKMERDAPEAKSDKKKLTTEVATSLKDMTTYYFREHPQQGCIGEQKVTRVYVVDPDTGESDNVVYLNSDDVVVLNIAGKNFESEAWNIAKWAAKHGYVFQWHEVSVAV
jgi:hypothetical protein